MCSDLSFDDNRTFERNVYKIKGETSSSLDSYLVLCFCA